MKSEWELIRVKTGCTSRFWIEISCDHNLPSKSENHGAKRSLEFGSLTACGILIAKRLCSKPHISYWLRIWPLFAVANFALISTLSAENFDFCLLRPKRTKLLLYGCFALWLLRFWFYNQHATWLGKIWTSSKWTLNIHPKCIRLRRHQPMFHLWVRAKITRSYPWLAVTNRRCDRPSQVKHPGHTVWFLGSRWKSYFAL